MDEKMERRAPLMVGVVLLLVFVVGIFYNEITNFSTWTMVTKPFDLSGAEKIVIEYTETNSEQKAVEITDTKDMEILKNIYAEEYDDAVCVTCSEGNIKITYRAEEWIFNVFPNPYGAVVYENSARSDGHYYPGEQFAAAVDVAEKYGFTYRAL